MGQKTSNGLTTAILIPTLNEIDGMRVILPRIKKEWYQQLIIVDGGSTDGTVEYAREHGYQLIIQKSKGVRGAYREAFPHIRSDIVIPFSPDGNCIPEVIPQLVEKMKEGYDMVIASRYAKGAKSEDDDLLTGFGNWMFTTLINTLYGGRYTDVMGMYRAWKTHLFQELELGEDEGFVSEKLVGVTGIGLDPLLSIRSLKRKLKVTDIPASEPVRIGGTRKMLPFRWGLVILLQTFRELYFWRK